MVIDTPDLGVSSNTGAGARGVFGGGNAPTATNVIEYITISTLGNVIDFGDLTQARAGIAACSSSIRGVFGGGYSPSINVIDYITILSAGNATDFGDLTQARHQVAGLSNGHGGL